MVILRPLKAGSVVGNLDKGRGLNAIETVGVANNLNRVWVMKYRAWKLTCNDYLYTACPSQWLTLLGNKYGCKECHYGPLYITKWTMNNLKPVRNRVRAHNCDHWQPFQDWLTLVTCVYNIGQVNPLRWRRQKAVNNHLKHHHIIYRVF